MSWTLAEALGLRVGVAAYLVAAATALPGLRRLPRADLLVALGIGVGVVALGGALAVRWSGAGQGPFLTLYEVIVSNAFSLGLVFAIAASRDAVVREAMFAPLAVLALLGVWAAGLPRTVAPLPPTFASPWLWAHVLSGKAFLACCLIAAAIGLRLARGAPEARLVTAFWRYAGIALACDAAMLLAGALWARSAWGRYWNWDPVETWALITWLLLAALLHARRSAWLRPGLAGAGMVAIFALALVTFLGVPFFSHAPHKGVF